MKRFLAFLLSLLLLTGCGEKATAPQPEFRLLTFTSEYLTGGVVTAVTHTENTYNEAGQCIRWVRYDDGVQTESADYTYDEAGNPSRYVYHTAEGTAVTTFTYTMDTQGNLLRMESYLDGRLNFTEENTYDARGRLKRCTETPHQEDGTQDALTRTYTYHWLGGLAQRKDTHSPSGSCQLFTFKDGKVDQATYFDAAGTVTDYFTHYYDDTGFEYQWIRCGSDGTVEHTCKRRKDDTGLVITELHYDEKGIQTNRHDVFTYDEYGNLLIQERYENGEVYWRLSQTYKPITKPK